MAIKDVGANEDTSASLPLITSSPSATAGGDRTSTIQTLGNIIVSIVGTGVLGLPYAFRVAGWFAASLGVIIVGFATYYCMLLLVKYLLISLSCNYHNCSPSPKIISQSTKIFLSKWMIG